MRINKRTIRKSNRQKAWQYMRRNPMFSIKDILLILEMTEKSLMMLVRQLVNDNYLRQFNGGHVFKDRSYKLIKNTGVICPQWIVKQKKLFDVNIKEFGHKNTAQGSKESSKTEIKPFIPDEQLKKEVSQLKEKEEDLQEIDHRPVPQNEYDEGRILQVLQGEVRGVGRNTLKNRCGVSPSAFNMALESLQNEGVVLVDSGIYKILEVKNHG